jgi:putative DNA-invertase from lambdoid prophage Rac
LIDIASILCGGKFDHHAGRSASEDNATLQYRGRKPSYTRRQLDYVLAMLGKETSTSAIAKAIGLSRQTVLRIKADPAKAHRVAELWGNN